MTPARQYAIALLFDLRGNALKETSLVLVTGGAGYIGSHITLSLLEAGHGVVVFDNLSNSSAESISRIEKICGKKPHFVMGDIRDKQALSNLFNRYHIDSVIHCAGLKAVGESVKDPLTYFSNNLVGSVTLLETMARANIFRLVFSSSATVYGDSPNMPVNEKHPTAAPTNPYGRSKLMVEDVLRDLATSDQRWSIATARYFNPIGAHSSGLIGEAPNGTPNNLVPYISQVAIGKLEKLQIFGGDYPTPDGTGVRDYIHVMDLAQGHLKALHAINLKNGLNIWNFGSGKGYSVLELLGAFENASGKKIPYDIVARRAGDIPKCWANTDKARQELGWRAEKNLNDMMIDTWRWQKNNPTGYN